MDQSIFQLLGMYLLLAIIFEEGFSLLFKWRYFIVFVDEKGLKTPIMIGLSYWVFKSYGLDIVSGVLQKFKEYGIISVDLNDVNSAGVFLTAVLIAGGSSTVYSILDKHFEFRDYAANKKRILNEEEEKKKSKKLTPKGLTKEFDILKKRIKKSDVYAVKQNEKTLIADLEDAFDNIKKHL